MAELYLGANLQFGGLEPPKPMAGYVPIPRAASAEGARIETLKAPRGWSSWGGGVPLPAD